MSNYNDILKDENDNIKLSRKITKENESVEKINENNKREDMNDEILNNVIPMEDYKNIHSNIINEKMLIEQVKKDNNIRRKSIADEFYYAKYLSLENKNIILIQNISLFKNLEELCLDNNFIEEIVNLDNLINLRMLSISNNKIKKIKGLNNLINLSELNLHNNQIDRIENLNNNLKLKVLVLSKNHIEDIDNIKMLKDLKKLKFLNLLDNPICNFKDISKEIIIHLKSVKYFNNNLIEKNINEYINKNEENIKTVLYMNKNNEIKHPYKKKIKEAYLYEVTILSNTLFDEKQEPIFLIKINEYIKLKKEFIQNIESLNNDMINNVLLLNEDKQKKLDTFDKDLKQLISKNISDKIEHFKRLKKRVKTTIKSILTFLNCETKINNIEIVTYPYKNKKLYENDIIDYKIQKKINDISKNLDMNEDVINEIENKIKENSSNFENNKIEKKENFNKFENNKIEEKENSNNFENKKIEEKEKINIVIEKDKYELIKNYINKNIDENFTFGKTLINDELMIIVSLNNFIKKFKTNISNIVNVINESITSFFQKIVHLENDFISYIMNYLSTENNNASVIFKEEEINEFYNFKSYRSNILSNLEEYITSTYNKSITLLLENIKKQLSIKSRERIQEIEHIVDKYNNLFYSYLSFFCSE